MTESNEERDRIVCIPAEWDPPVESIQVECIECGAQLWRSTASLGQDCDPMCAGCLPADAKPGVAPQQIKQMAEVLGVTPVEMAARLSAMGFDLI